MNFPRIILRLNHRATFQAIKVRPITLAVSSKLKTDFKRPSFASAPFSTNQRVFQKEENSTNFHVQNDDDFNTRVLKAKIPIIVDFHAEWCAPCKMLAPRLEVEVDKYGGKVMLAKVDVDDFPDFAIKFKVKAVPTVMLFRDGESVNKFKGNLDDDKLEKFVKDSLEEKK